MAITVVQAVASPTLSATSPNTITAGANFTVGNLIVVLYIADDTSGGVVTSASVSGSFTKAVGETTTRTAEIWYAVCDIAGHNTVTVATGSTLNLYPSGDVLELSGVKTSSPVLTSGTNTASSANLDCPSISATAAGQLFFGGGYHLSGVRTSATQPGGIFTTLFGAPDGGNICYDVGHYGISTGAGALNPSIQAVGTNTQANAAVIFDFQPAAGGGMVLPTPFPPFAPPFGLNPHATPFQQMGDLLTPFAEQALGGAIVLSGTAAPAGAAAGMAGSIAFTGTSTANADTGAVAGSITFAGTANAGIGVTAPAGAITFGGTAASSASVTATGSLTFSGTAAGAVTGALGDFGNLNNFPPFAPPFGVPTAPSFQQLGDDTLVLGAVAPGGAITFSGTAAAAPVVTAAGALVLSGANVPSSSADSASGSLTFGGSVTPAAPASSIAGAIVLSASAQPTVPADPNQWKLGTPAPMFVNPYQASYQLQGDMSPPLVGTAATGSLTFGGSAAAPSVDAGTASGAIAFTGSVTGAGGITASGAMALTALSVLAQPDPGSPAGSIVLSGAASSGNGGNAFGAIVFAGTTSGTVTASPNSGTLVLSGADISAQALAVAAGQIAFSALVNAFVRLNPAGFLVLSGTSTSAAGALTGNVHGAPNMLVGRAG